ncbi:MAG: hypothetical protein LBT60_07180, partial [Oscillospiraceae bacterium]|nr:hypothetical protein [Oscillospiraceae bacterium]
MTSKSRVLCFALILACLGLAAPGGLALGAGGDVPNPETLYKYAPVGSEITFSTEEFAGFFGETLILDGIVLAELPPPSEGALKCGGREMLAGEAVVAEALNSLRFVPAAKREVSASFRFLPVFQGRLGESIVTVELRLGRENQAPTVEDMTLVTYKNTALTKRFRGSDPDGD